MTIIVPLGGQLAVEVERDVEPVVRQAVVVPVAPVDRAVDGDGGIVVGDTTVITGENQVNSGQKRELIPE